MEIMRRELRPTHPYSSNADSRIFNQLHGRVHFILLPLLLPLSSDRAQEAYLVPRATIPSLREFQRHINGILPLPEDYYNLLISRTSHPCHRLTGLNHPHQPWIYNRWSIPISDEPQDQFYGIFIFYSMFHGWSQDHGRLDFSLSQASIADPQSIIHLFF